MTMEWMDACACCVRWPPHTWIRRRVAKHAHVLASPKSVSSVAVSASASGMALVWCTSTRRRRASHLDVSASASGMALVWCTSTRRRRVSHLEPSPPLWSRRPSSRCGSVKKLLCRGSFRTLLLCTLITSQGQLMCAIKRSSLNRSPSSKLSLTVTVVDKRSQLPVPSQSQPSTQVVMPAPTHCGNPPSFLVKSSSTSHSTLLMLPCLCRRLLFWSWR